MIAMLMGTLKQVEAASIIVDVNGVGYQVSIPARNSGALLVGTSVSLHTTLIVREDSLTLFGFEDLYSRRTFDLLLTATGIGPKVALSALSIYSADELSNASATENEAALAKIPGLGKKGVQRLIMELKDKLQSSASAPVARDFTWSAQIEQALLGLGFTQRQSSDAIAQLTDSHGSAVVRMDLSELLKAALRTQGRD